MNILEIVRAVIPNANNEVVDFLMWNRTPFPIGPTPTKSIYRAASTWQRACKNKIALCDFCDNKVATKFLCVKCDSALKSALNK